jgi:hypothetical protein
MPSRMFSQPLFDLVSYARRGPGQRDRLSPAEVDQIVRIVRRTPEVMVKVLPRGANDRAAVRKHLDYIGRKGELDLETDDGERLRGNGVGDDLVEDWALELDEHRSKSDLVATRGRQAPRLVHKLMFSMPAGTPSDKVLAAVRNFCREEFALKHRYAMTLHTDEPHPHVHVVIKAMSEQGQRMHIRKAMIHRWRADFAQHLRTLGVPANATQRFVRGETCPRKSDGIYRASLRGASTHVRNIAQAVASDLLAGSTTVESGRSRLLETRKVAARGWLAVSDILVRQGMPGIGAQARRFVETMPPPRTDRDWIGTDILRHLREPRINVRSKSP